MPIIDFDSECWADPWVQERAPLGKLLFVYLWTNSHRNASGIYIITKKTMADETGLNKKQIDELLRELYPKVKYDSDRSVCWVVKHARRQFLRKENISDQVKKGIRNAAMKFSYHPFFMDYIKQYPEIFSKEEIETLYRPSIDNLRHSIESQGEGKGEGKGREEEKGGMGEKEGGNSILIKKDAFGEFWSMYPPRNGKKIGKEEALKMFSKLPINDVDLCLQAVRNYANSSMVREGIGIKDAHRFLWDGKNKKWFWKEWIEPEKSNADSKSFSSEKKWLALQEAKDEAERQRKISGGDCEDKGFSTRAEPDG